MLGLQADPDIKTREKPASIFTDKNKTANEFYKPLKAHDSQNASIGVSIALIL